MAPWSLGLEQACSLAIIAGDLGGLFGTEGVDIRGDESFLIPAAKACGGAKKGEVFASSAEIFKGFGERGRGVIIKQQKALWNVFLHPKKETTDESN
jgi:hypothetical protein